MMKTSTVAACPGVVPASALVSPPGRACDLGGDMMKQALEYLDRGFSVIPMSYIPPKDGEKKGSKVPLVKWKDFQNVRPTREQVTEWWTKWPMAMIGVITGSISGVCTIDVDDDSGYEVLVDLIPDSMTIPTYSTPSGGCQMVFAMPDTQLLSAVRNLPGCDLRAERGIAIFPPSKNPIGSYTWRKGLSLQEVELPGLPSSYLDKISSSSSVVSSTNNNKNKIIYKGGVTTAETPCYNPLHELQGVTFSYDDGSRNASIFHLAITLIRGGMSQSEVEYAVRNAAKTCVPPLNDQEVSSILSSAFARKFGRIRNIHCELESWVIETTGNFRVSEAYAELQLVTKEERGAARTALTRLCSTGLIERVGDKNGSYRLKRSDCDDIDFLNADTTPFDVTWPLGVDKYVELYRKSIVIIAGQSNAGKTAYCLNVARENMAKHRINYFLSEGDPAELRVRLEKFGEPLSIWKNVKFKTPKGANLSKIIVPDGFNIIDYLEIHKDFYEVSGIINDVYENLTTGIAVIAMQKPEGRDLGVGGRGTLDKARLYLAIEPGRIKIVKGKIWAREGINPNGMTMQWSLVGGCKFFPKGLWMN